MPHDEEDKKGSHVSMKVDLSSIDAMFARVLSEGGALKEYVRERLNRQDRLLEDLLKQTLENHQSTTQKVTSLERDRDVTRGKIRGFVLGWGVIVGLLGFLLQKVIDKVFK